jgi:hypothetical protein
MKDNHSFRYRPPLKSLSKFIRYQSTSVRSDKAGKWRAYIGFCGRKAEGKGLLREKLCGRKYPDQ